MSLFEDVLKFLFLINHSNLIRSFLLVMVKQGSLEVEKFNCKIEREEGRVEGFSNES